VQGADRLLRRHLEREPNNLHARQGADMLNNLRRLLRKSVVTENCSVADAAKQLHMHERTLNRRLRDEGTTFRQLLDEIRCEVAKQLLAGSTMPLARIATALGYADASAFSRAFKRWSGSTPAQWRVRNARR
jgi:AraC-like DNA-binding protein